VRGAYSSWVGCDRRVIGTTPEGKHVVLDLSTKGVFIWPGLREECRLFIHRAAARDALAAIAGLRQRSQQ
jgi:hypothetical protein